MMRWATLSPNTPWSVAVDPSRRSTTPCRITCESSTFAMSTSVLYAKESSGPTTSSSSVSLVATVCGSSAPLLVGIEPSFARMLARVGLRDSTDAAILEHLHRIAGHEVAAVNALADQQRVEIRAIVVRDV